MRLGPIVSTSWLALLVGFASGWIVARYEAGWTLARRVTATQ